MTPWIRTVDELTDFVASLAGCPALAVDTESDSLYHHVEKVCLIQIAPAQGPARLIDPLALRELAPLAPVFADATVTKVFHGADYDVTTLKRDFGFAFAGVFDTMIAARFLGRAHFGLQALLGAELGIEVSKGGQKDDWSRRPLGPEQEAYALADVEHLLPLRERLDSELSAVGRLSWVLEECDVVAALPPARRRNDPDAYQKIKGAQRLTGQGLAVLRELHSWRERCAEKTDIPPYRILRNETLLALASAPPRTDGELRRVPGAARLRREAVPVLEAVQRAMVLAEADLPRFVRPPRLLVPAAVRRRADALRALRTAEAARTGLDPSVVLPQKLIDRLAEAAPRAGAELERIDGVRRWRIDAYGASILAALAAV